ncbi:MAG: hybrid sensor histidine kinase/response regulator [Gemmatimonadota bacterium]|nr:hybrid sensor histidine kinase/response regulator [Gemmatimonadota bacterium]
MPSRSRDLALLARRAAAAPATRWRMLPLTVQLMLLTQAIVVAWMLMTRAYDRVAGATRGVEDRGAHWQRAEIMAARIAAAGYEMQVAVRAHARTGDTMRLREARDAGRRHTMLLDTLHALSGVDADIVRHVADYRTLAVRWHGAAHERIRARTAGINGRAAATRERTLFDSLHKASMALSEELHARERVARAEMDAQIASREWFLLRVGPIVTVLVLLSISGLLLRQTLLAVSTAARAVAEGRYADVRMPVELTGNREMRQIAKTFEQLALAIEEREQILHSDILQLREYEQMKSDFVATVSHELRTPLTSMRGALGLLLSGAAGPLSPQGRELLLIANQNTDRLIRLINDILDIEKIESGTITVRCDRCDVKEVLEATIAGVAEYAREHAVRVRLLAVESAEVMGDQDRLIQVFTNLISNAIKFSPAGGEITVTLEATAGVTHVSVRDRGAGIPPEFQERIFGKFQQAESSASRRHGGTGLGLAIARAIVERHEGTISFTTTAGVGTTFLVELPCAPVPVAHASDAAAQHHVLVVDPDADIVRILETLAGPMVNLVPAATGNDAMRLARQTTFDALIIEPDLPNENGLELVRELRMLRHYTDLPVIVFSANEYHATMLEGVTLSPAHAYVKARDREDEVVMRLRAMLTARVS